MHAWLHRIDQHFPVRYTRLAAAAPWLRCCSPSPGSPSASAAWWRWCACSSSAWAGATRGRRATRCCATTRSSGTCASCSSSCAPEIRQYFIESDNEAAPFSRQQRSLVYQRAKGDSDKRPFGTQLDVHAVGYEWINHSMAPTVLRHARLSRRDRRRQSCTQPYSASIFNISAMSFGALSANAILALNGGAQQAATSRTTPARARSAGTTACTAAT